MIGKRLSEIASLAKSCPSFARKHDLERERWTSLTGAFAVCRFPLILPNSSIDAIAELETLFDRAGFSQSVRA